MHWIERVSCKLRHLPILERWTGLWGTVRPLYDIFIRLIGKNGLRRVINQTDSLLVHPDLRQISEVHEPEVWRHMMSRIRIDDVIVDIGAFVGLYTVTFAKKIGKTGRVYAFEPDHKSFEALKTQVTLNKVSDRALLIRKAVDSKDGLIRFDAGRGFESQIKTDLDGGVPVEAVCLDTFFLNERVDLIKIDVEGFEERVIQGGQNLLRDPDRSPRLIYIEVHPYAWPKLGLSDRSLLSLLDQSGYEVRDLAENPVRKITDYGEIVAHKKQ